VILLHNIQDSVLLLQTAAASMMGDVALRWREWGTAAVNVKSISQLKDSLLMLSSARVNSTPFMFE